jgi:hypothetical protein
MAGIRFAKLVVIDSFTIQLVEVASRSRAVRVGIYQIGL